VERYACFSHLILGHIAAAGDGDANGVVDPLGRRILLEQLAEPACLHAHHRVGGWVEAGILAEDVYGDRKALQPAGFAGLFSLYKVTE